MTKVDIISGFLGAGKTTLIKKLIKEVFAGQKVVLIENEFGEIGIDGGFLKDAGINITEMNSGCICCSLVGDFGKALKKVVEEYHPERIIIEPSGVGKLSDVEKAVMDASAEAELVIATTTAVVDAKKAKVYMKNFGEFFNNQVESARCVILSRTQDMSEEKIHETVHMIREKNPECSLITTAWEEITGDVIFGAMNDAKALEKELMLQQEHEHTHEHHYDENGVCECGHHHDEEDEECGCGHHHHENEDGEDGHDEEHCCGHHHHEHEEGEKCGSGHHHHEHEDGEDGHDEEHCCGHHHHEHEHEEGEECGCGHHHHHHADEVFTSWGRQTPRKYTKDELEKILENLSEGDRFGQVLRAKGIVPSTEGVWLHFDLTPGEYEIREGAADYTGRLCVIGAKLDETGLEKLFCLG